MKFLYAAYAATWLIHGSYILYLFSRFRRLREEERELDQSSAK